MKKVLVVDDENNAAELLSFNLRVAGFEVSTAANGHEGLCKARALMPGLILLDVMLPEIDGFEVCRLLRQDPLTCEIPIIMLTAMTSEISRLVGLESGADEYLTKPVSPRQLISRVNSLLRDQARKKPRGQFHLKDLFVDLANHFVTVNGARVELTKREFKLLSFVAQAILRRMEAAAPAALARHYLDL